MFDHEIEERVLGDQARRSRKESAKCDTALPLSAYSKRQPLTNIRHQSVGADEFEHWNRRGADVNNLMGLATQLPPTAGGAAFTIGEGPNRTGMAVPSGEIITTS